MDQKNVVKIGVGVSANIPMIGPAPIIQGLEVQEAIRHGAGGLAEEKKARDGGGSGGQG
jgi:hypothetical protein